MKQRLHTAPAFTPNASGLGTLHFTAIPDFDISRLYAVINVTRNAVIYGIGQSGIGGTNYNAGTKVLNLQYDTSTHDDEDVLTCIYDYEIKTFRHISTTSTNALVIKASRGIVFSYNVSSVYSSADIDSMFALYDSSSPPTVGTSTPKVSSQFYIYTSPRNSTPIPGGAVFTNGISMSLSAGLPTLIGAPTGDVTARYFAVEVIYA